MTTSISISTEHGSSFTAELFNSKLLTIDYITNLCCEGLRPHLYDAGRIQIHGTRADLQKLAAAITDAISPEVPNAR